MSEDKKVLYVSKKAKQSQLLFVQKQKPSTNEIWISKRE